VQILIGKRFCASVALGLALFSSSLWPSPAIDIKINSKVCVSPYKAYEYKLCQGILFNVDSTDFYIPTNFHTDLASIPRVFWPILAPAHSSLMRAAIVHDWFYRMTCDFTRKQTDLIFYYMLRQDGIGWFSANVLYYAVRLFGAKHYNEDFCEWKISSNGLKNTKG
jgi:hypothetical protein